MKISGARSLLIWGAVLLFVSLAGQFLSQALMGQQPTDLTADVPWAAFTVLSFVWGAALMTGSAMIAGFFVVRVLTGHGTDRSAVAKVVMSSQSID